MIYPPLVANRFAAGLYSFRYLQMAMGPHMGSAQSFLSFLISFVFFISLPSLMACDGFYRSILVPNSGTHMGSYHMPPRL